MEEFPIYNPPRLNKNTVYKLTGNRRKKIYNPPRLNKNQDKAKMKTVKVKFTILQG